MNKDDFKPKRHRRSKAELLAAGYYDRKNGGKKVQNDRKNGGKKIEDFLVQKKVLEEKGKEVTEKIDTYKESISKMKTMDEICEEQIQRAKDKNLPNPDFDFRNSYSKGQIIYYVETNELVGSKKMLELKISSVYPRAIIAYEDMGMAHTIGLEDDEMIFLDRRDAESVYESMVVENKLEEYFQRQKQLANKRRLEKEKEI